jgi:hypothetical protein
MKQFKNIILINALLFFTTTIYANNTSLFNELKEMFKEMVEKKNASLIPTYYDKDFLLYTNGKTMNYQLFLSSHQKVYQTNIKYLISYDERSFVEQDDKIAARVFITTQKGKDKPKKIEVILIAKYKNNKIYRLWELTYPDWSKMKSFKKM